MKIYFSHVRQDTELAESVMAIMLKEHPEWEIVSYRGENVIGSDYKSLVFDHIRTSDAVVIFMSEAFEGSRYGNMEFDSALAFFSERNYPKIMPVILDRETIPWDVANIMCLLSPERDIEKISKQLIDSLVRIDIGNRIQLNTDRQERVEKDAPAYIQTEIQRLERQVKVNKRFAYSCNIVCFLLLGACLFFAAWKYNAVSQATQLETAQYIAEAIVTIVIISIAFAMARFPYILGKTYMVEAIRNLDRIHAMSFGDFYLKLHGGRFEWAELKDILAPTWNIDIGSAFLQQDAKDIDPAILRTCIQQGKTPIFWRIFRLTALNFLVIQKYNCENLPCQPKNPLKI